MIQPKGLLAGGGVARVALALGGLLALIWAAAALLIGIWDAHQVFMVPRGWIAPPTHGSPYHPALVAVWGCAGIAALLAAGFSVRRPRTAAIVTVVAIIAGFAATATVGEIWYSHLTWARAVLAWLVPAAVLSVGAFTALRQATHSAGPQPNKQFEQTPHHGMLKAERKRIRRSSTARR